MKKLLYGIIVVFMALAVGACERKQENTDLDLADKSWREVLSTYKELDQLKVTIKEKTTTTKKTLPESRCSSWTESRGWQKMKCRLRRTVNNFIIM